MFYFNSRWFFHTTLTVHGNNREILLSIFFFFFQSLSRWDRYSTRDVPNRQYHDGEYLQLGKLRWMVLDEDFGLLPTDSCDSSPQRHRSCIWELHQDCQYCMSYGKFPIAIATEFFFLFILIFSERNQYVRQLDKTILFESRKRFFFGIGLSTCRTKNISVRSNIWCMFWNKMDF